MAKITQQSAVFSEDEFIAKGGSQMTIDLSKLCERRVREAIHSVFQLAEDELTALAIHSAAVMGAIVDDYIFLCTKEERLLEPVEVFNAIQEAMLEELSMIKRHMETKEDNGKSHFENLRDQGRAKAEEIAKARGLWEKLMPPTIRL